MKTKSVEEKNISRLVLYAIALAMAITSVVLSILGQFSTNLVILLGIGMFCLAVAGIDSLEKGS